MTVNLYFGTQYMIEFSLVVAYWYNQMKLSHYDIDVFKIQLNTIKGPEILKGPALKGNQLKSTAQN